VIGHREVAIEFGEPLEKICVSGSRPPLVLVFRTHDSSKDMI